ncbi:SDR family oxidoreductase [Variovorax beijingensis]|uniref:SDR family oxidoreductase n=1 Tax=Variovorax beijingensis TaxID=2496117 RepID=A0ABY0A298_9BURK|nr:SDR family oxidoreductase [Variovorax beijingensis]RSZ32477.1 SDR family oxidoreductase [Variovorax beijingensis]
MKIVIIGGSGLIGSKLAARLRHTGHEVVAASPSTGVNTLTGEGLKEALAGAQVVVDVANSPSFEDEAVLRFFETSGRNLLAAEAEAGVAHHIALSVVGTDRLLASGYFRAKQAQEDLIGAASVPYTIVQATQFFEFLAGIANAGAAGSEIRLSHALVQPIAAEDVAAALADIVNEPPAGGRVEIAGPEAVPLDDLVRRFLAATGDARQVVADAEAAYFGVRLDDRSLTPAAGARLAPTGFEAWLRQRPKA